MVSGDSEVDQRVQLRMQPSGILSPELLPEERSQLPETDRCTAQGVRGANQRQLRDSLLQDDVFEQFRWDVREVR